MPRHQADDEAWDGYTRHSYHYDPEGQAKGWHTGRLWNLWLWDGSSDTEESKLPHRKR